MSDTPETFEFASKLRGLGTGYYQALDLCRKLERERDKARNQVRDIVCAAESVGWNGVENSKILTQFIKDLAEDRDEARKERDDLKTRLALMDDFKSEILQGYATAIGCAGHESPVRKAELLAKERDELRAEIERLKGLARFEIDGAFSYLPNELVIQHTDPFAAMALTFAKLNNEIAKLRADAAMKGAAK